MVFTGTAEIGENVGMEHRMAQWAKAGTLATRERGAEARTAIEREIDAQMPGAPIALSFADVADMTYAFAEECVAKLLGDRLAGFYEDHPLLALDVSRDVEATLNAVLRDRGLLLLAFGDGPVLLGGPSHLEQTVAAALRLGGEFSVADLAAELDLSAPAANNRIHQLRQAGAVTRARVIPRRGGNEFRYKLAEPGPRSNGRQLRPARRSRRAGTAG